MPVSLPSNPDLDHLRGQARTLQRRIRAGDPAALQWIRDRIPPGLTARSGGRRPVSCSRLIPSWCATAWPPQPRPVTPTRS